MVSFENEIMMQSLISHQSSTINPHFNIFAVMPIYFRVNTSKVTLLSIDLYQRKSILITIINEKV